MLTSTREYRSLTLKQQQVARIGSMMGADRCTWDTRVDRSLKAAQIRYPMPSSPASSSSNGGGGGAAGSVYYDYSEDSAVILKLIGIGIVLALAVYHRDQALVAVAGFITARFCRKRAPSGLIASLVYLGGLCLTAYAIYLSVVYIPVQGTLTDPLAAIIIEIFVVSAQGVIWSYDKLQAFL